MKAIREDAGERVIYRLLEVHKRRRRRKIGVWWPRDNGVPRLHAASPSEHLTRTGVRYNRFLRMRRRIRGDWS